MDTNYIGVDCAGIHGKWRSEKSLATNESTVSICREAASIESCIFNYYVRRLHNF